MNLQEMYIKIAEKIDIPTNIMNLLKSKETSKYLLGLDALLKLNKELFENSSFTIEFSGCGDSLNDFDIDFHPYMNDKLIDVIKDNKYDIIDIFINFNYYNDEGGGGTIKIDLLSATSEVYGYVNEIIETTIIDKTYSEHDT